MGPGLWGVTGNPVAESERKRHIKTCEQICVKSGFLSEYEMQSGKEGFAGDTCERRWLINGVEKTYSGHGVAP